MMDYNISTLESGDELYAEASTGNKQWVAIITDTHPKYNYEREFVAYQKPRTTKRDSGRASIGDGNVVEMVRYTHSGKNDSRVYYQYAAGELHEIDESEIAAALEGVIVNVRKPREIDWGALKSCVENKAVEFAAAEAIEAIGSQADTATELVVLADGGQVADNADPDPADYDIDPTELAFESEHRGPRHCVWRDDQNNVTNHLAQLDNSDVWVAYRSWQTGPSEFDTAIKGIGRLSIEAIDLDQEVIVNSIREQCDELASDNPDDEESQAMADTLSTHAGRFAEALVEEWQHGVDEVCTNQIWDGVSPVDGTTVWASHVEEGITIEAQYALGDVSRQIDYEPLDDGIEPGILATALYASIDERRDSWRRPHLEYEGELSSEIEGWELRALELEQNSSLPKQTARVVALLELGHQPFEVAETLDISPSTVTRHRDRARRIQGEAQWLVENGPEV